LSGCRAAAGNVISSWTDSSGNGYSFSGDSGPKQISGWNGLPAARFYPGSSTALNASSFPGLVSDNLSIFAVVDRKGIWFRNGQSANDSGAYGLILCAGSYPESWQFDFYGDDSEFGGPQDQFSRASLHGYQGAANANQEPANRVFSGPALVGAIYSAGGNTYYSDTSTVSEPAWGSFNTNGGSAVLGQSCGGGYGLYGDLYELQVYNTALSGTALSNVLSYFTNKYPLNRANATQVIFDGNSIMDGLWSSGNSQASLFEAATNYAYNVVSEAIGYYDTETLNATAPKVIDAYASEAYTTQIVALWEIYNSIVNRGDTAAEVETALTNYAAGRHAAGFKVVLATCLDSSAIGTSGSLDTVRNAVNTWLRANWRTIADGLADVDSDPTIGGEGNYTNGTYFYSDGVHLTAAGEAIASPYFQTAIEALIP